MFLSKKPKQKKVHKNRDKIKYVQHQFYEKKWADWSFTKRKSVQNLINGGSSNKLREREENQKNSCFFDKIYSLTISYVFFDQKE